MLREHARRIHGYSAIILILFIACHLINHLCGIGGSDLHAKVMVTFREVYRFWLVEPLLLFVGLLQIVTGVFLAWKKKLEKHLISRLQIISGLYLSFFLVYHVRAIMLGRYAWNVDTDFHFAAWGVKNYPSMLFFIPYYGLAITSFFIHMACVHYTKMIDRSNVPAICVSGYRNILVQTVMVMVTGVILASIIILTLTIK